MADEDALPSFDDPFDGTDVEQRVFGTVLRTRSPTGARAVAERADCDPKTARKYLDWFVELGIVTRHDGRPTTYERNDAYFEWRRIDRLAREHSQDELQQRVSDLSDRIRAYERRYGAPNPGAVDAVAEAAAGEDGTIDDVYRDLSDWETARYERRLHERARRQRAGSTEPVSG